MWGSPTRSDDIRISNDRGVSAWAHLKKNPVRGDGINFECADRISRGWSDIIPAAKVGRAGCCPNEQCEGPQCQLRVYLNKAGDIGDIKKFVSWRLSERQRHRGGWA